MENSMEAPQKAKNRTTIGPSNSTVCVYTHTHAGPCTHTQEDYSAAKKNKFLAICSNMVGPEGHYAK